MPAGAVLLVGGEHGLDARRSRGGRRSIHLPAALPHQRAQRVRPGADQRRPDRRRAAVLRLRLLVARRRGGRDGDLPARRDGLDPRQAAALARRPGAPRPYRACARHAGRPARGLPRPLRRHDPRRLRHDRDERRDRRARWAPASGDDGLRDAGLPGEDRRRSRRGDARRHARRARAACRRALRLRDRLLADGGEDGRVRGATSGSTAATAPSGTPMAASAFSTE